MMKEFTFWKTDENDYDYEETIKLPVKKEVCHRCRGEGSHVNPAVDGNGISPEEFINDPDFEEAYFSGVYDVICEECHGENVIDVIDEAQAARMGLKEQCEAYLEYESERARQASQDAALYRAECGYQW